MAMFQSTASRDQQVFAALNALTDEMLAVTQEVHSHHKTSKATQNWQLFGSTSATKSAAPSFSL